MDEKIKKENKFWTKYRDKIYYVLIVGMFIYIIYPYLKSLIIKPKADSLPQTINSSSNIIKQDSGLQNANQIKQENKNSGDVKNEFIGRDKNISNKTYTIKKSGDTQIVNNGFLNQGGQGNTYNQTINKNGIEQRHLSNNDKSYLLTVLPLSYNIKIHSTLGDAETIKYAEEINDFLKRSGYRTELAYSVFVKPEFGIIGLIMNDSLKNVDVDIFSNITPDSKGTQ